MDVHCVPPNQLLPLLSPSSSVPGRLIPDFSNRLLCCLSGVQPAGGSSGSSEVGVLNPQLTPCLALVSKVVVFLCLQSQLMSAWDSSLPCSHQSEGGPCLLLSLAPGCFLFPTVFTEYCFLLH